MSIYAVLHCINTKPSVLLNRRKPTASIANAYLLSVYGTGRSTYMYLYEAVFEEKYTGARYSITYFIIIHHAKSCGAGRVGKMFLTPSAVSPGLFFFVAANPLTTTQNSKLFLGNEDNVIKMRKKFQFHYFSGEFPSFELEFWPFFERGSKQFASATTFKSMQEFR